MSELLHCPFCRSVAETPTQTKKTKRLTRCRNPNCEIFGVFVDVRKWNSRQQPASTSAQVPDSGWISVEDALPKAQKQVLIRYLNHHGKLTTTMGWYCPAKTVESGCFDGEVDDEYDDVSDTHYMKEQWVDESSECEYHYPITGVTHWQPLPAPPAPKE